MSGVTSTTGSSAGGSATQQGTDFQNRVAAWGSAHSLVEGGANLWGLAAGVALAGVLCETGEPIDDVCFTTTVGGVALVQAKHTLTASTAQNSEFAKVWEQFARQWIRGLGIESGTLAHATGLSAGYCAQIRDGKRVPHVRHWATMQLLGLTRAT
jgi:hypothetical protein